MLLFAGTVSGQTASNYLSEPYLLADTYPGPTPPGAGKHGPCGYSLLIGPALILPVWHPIEQHADLWRTDGTPEGTYELDLGGVPYGEVRKCLGPVNTLFNITGERYFVGLINGGEWVLLATDSTQNGTRIVAGPFRSIYPETGELPGRPGEIWFLANNGTSQRDRTMWTSDGTVDGTRQVDIYSEEPYMEIAGEIDSDLVFSRIVRDASGGFVTELWRGDGSYENTTRFLVHDHSYLVGAPKLREGEFLYLLQEIEDSTIKRFRLMKSNGSPGHAAEVATLPNHGNVGNQERIGDSLLFTTISLHQGNFEYFVWLSDATREGTRRLYPTGGAAPFADIKALTRVTDDAFIFLASPRDQPSTYSLWGVGGVSMSLEQLVACPSERCHSNYFVSAFSDDEVLVSWRNGLRVQTIVTDGTLEGTSQVVCGLDSQQETLLGTYVRGLYAFAWRTGEGPDDVLKVCLKTDDQEQFELALETESTNTPSPAAFFGDRLIFSKETPELGNELWAIDLYPPGQAKQCEPSDEVLCLQNGRYKIGARWRNTTTNENGTGTSQRFPGSERTGSFWFFRPDNTELLIKMIDGTAVNGKQWVYYGALSDVEYWIDIEDMTTGARQTYHNPAGEYCGGSDTMAFDAATTFIQSQPTSTRVLDQEACDASALCLNAGRFEVTATWKAGNQQGTGHPLPGTARTGYFWFFKPDNVELAIKILDGTSVNGHYWVYFAALSDTEYELTITDTTTGTTRIYRNPQGTLCGQRHIDAF